jgi:hypothetical protein
MEEALLAESKRRFSRHASNAIEPAAGGRRRGFGDTIRNCPTVPVAIVFGTDERLIAGRHCYHSPRAASRILSLTSGVRRCQRATSRRNGKSVQAVCRQGENGRSSSVAYSLAETGTRAQVPPPALLVLALFQSAFGPTETRVAELG